LKLAEEAGFPCRQPVFPRNAEGGKDSGQGDMDSCIVMTVIEAMATQSLRRPSKTEELQIKMQI